MKALFHIRFRRIIAFGFLLLFFWANAQSGATPNEIFKVAFSAYQSGDYGLAIKNFNTAIELDPNRNYFYYNRGMTYKAMGVIPTAIEDFRKSLELKETAEAHYQIGVIKYQNEEYDVAKKEFESAKLIREDFDYLNFYLGMIYFHEEKYEPALKCFQDYTLRTKNNPEAYYHRGYCEAKLGKFQESLISLNFAKDFKTRDWKYYYKMYEVYLAMNDKENALNNISMVIETGETKPEFYEKRAELFLALGDTSRQKEDLEAAKGLKSSGGKGL